MTKNHKSCRSFGDECTIGFLIINGIIHFVNATSEGRYDARFHPFEYCPYCGRVL